MSVYQFKAKTIDGKEISLQDYQGKTLLIVNVASKCGFTPQYEGLEKLYKKYKDQGFTILGFPCNQFGSQEPGSEAEIQSFCSLTYGVDFPMFAKVDVNGANAHPLYKYLTNEKPGILGTEAIKWNFTKFLIDKQGEPIKRYSSADKPESLETDIEKALKSN
jgi:glutathione peroxidase